jgi:hypothetical protein
MLHGPTLKLRMEGTTLITLALTLGLALGCGGGREAQTVIIEPERPMVMVGETLSITAYPADDPAGDLAGGGMDWEVMERYGGGLLQSQGSHITYVPPEAAGTYHLTLRATGRNGHVRKREVEVRVLPAPMLEPAAAHVAPGGALQFRVHMKGLPRDAATWAVEEAEGGEVTPDGHYLAPRRPGLYHLTATSTLDPSASARATVTVGEN